MQGDGGTGGTSCQLYCTMKTATIVLQKWRGELLSSGASLCLSLGAFRSGLCVQPPSALWIRISSD